MSRKRPDKILQTALVNNMLVASNNQNGANEIVYKEFNTTIANLRTSTNLFYPSVLITDVGKEGLFKYDSTDTTTIDDNMYTIVDSSSRRYKRTTDVINSKLQVVTSTTNLIAYTQSSLCEYDGSIWEKMTGSNVASNGGTYAGTLINVNSSTYWSRIYDEYVNVKWFGAKGDGVTDDTSPIQLAINSFRNVFFPKGTYGTTSELSLLDNSNIKGVNGNLSIVKALGTGNFNLFYGQNITNTNFSNLGFYGNNQAVSSGDGQAIRCLLTTGATKNWENIEIINCKFDNFKGDYWINIYNTNLTYKIDGVTIKACKFQSYTGNSRNGSSTGVASACINISGLYGQVNYIENINVSNNFADANYIKSFLLLFSGTKNIKIDGNILKSSGLSSEISNESAAYAIMAYDSSNVNVPRNITITNNQIIGVRSCGLYMAGATEILIDGNIISGQIDVVNTSLPKGAISLNGCNNIVVNGNILKNNIFGINWVASEIVEPTNLIISNNKITNSTVNSIRLAINYIETSNVQVVNNIITGGSNSDACIYVVSTMSGSIYRLVIDNNNINTTENSSTGIRFVSSDNSYTFYDTYISNNIIKTSQQGIDVSITKYPIYLIGNKLIGSFSYAGINAQSALKVILKDNIFTSQNSGGKCFVTNSGTQGVMINNVFKDCNISNIYSISGNTLGYTAPWFSPTGYGEYIQNLDQYEQGVSLSKYIIKGWFWNGTAWYQDRTLTGN
jgi:hypothetical protein